MVENKDAEKINIGEFFTSDENAKDEVGGYTIRRSRAGTSGGNTARNVQVSSFRMTADKFWRNKLIRNTAICALAALVIWGIASTGTPAGQQAAGAIRGVIDYQSNLEKDLGDLKFVDSALDEDTAMVLAKESPAASPAASAEAVQAAAGAAVPSASASATVSPASSTDAASAAANAAGILYPLDGIVTTTFAESKSGVTITATDSKDIKSTKAGKVSKVSNNYLVVQNDDTSVTTYYGVKASVKKGSTVQAGQQIGQLLSQTLYVEETVNGEKTNPLS
jgi:murein DD-endopeptidase MepM/ murein hydrolase activator NlpD